jgi:pSer/pThr/pTyr-binding forkhead associated (FHA) protein
MEIKLQATKTKNSPYTLRDDTVSKQHFRIYSIIYEKDKLHDFPPLIYCEDLESTNGTYVNDLCIGMICRERIGHLLSDGDIIEIKPKTRFRFHQPIHQPEFRTKQQFDDLEVVLAPYP